MHGHRVGTQNTKHTIGATSPDLLIDRKMSTKWDALYRLCFVGVKTEHQSPPFSSLHPPYLWVHSPMSLLEWTSYRRGNSVCWGSWQPFITPYPNLLSISNPSTQSCFTRACAGIMLRQMLDGLPPRVAFENSQFWKYLDLSTR